MCHKLLFHSRSIFLLWTKTSRPHTTPTAGLYFKNFIFSFRVGGYYPLWYAIVKDLISKTIYLNHLLKTIYSGISCKEICRPILLLKSKSRLRCLSPDIWWVRNLQPVTSGTICLLYVAWWICLSSSKIHKW